MQSISWKRVFTVVGLLIALGFGGVFGYTQYNLSQLKYKTGECIANSIIAFEVKDRSGLANTYTLKIYSFFGYLGTRTYGKVDVENSSHNLKRVDCKTGEFLDEEDS